MPDFRLAYDAEGWTKERASWRSVVQLNVIRSVHWLLEQSDDHLLNLRLGPLKRVEGDLMRRFGAAATEPAPNSGHTPELFVRTMSSLPAIDDSEAQSILFACLPDIQTLYSSFKSRLEATKARSESELLGIEETPGFFLDDLDRICALDYVPSDDDVIRARLRTTGVQEWRIQFSGSRESSISPYLTTHEAN